ncbi:MAG: hypothetical protein U5N55_10900 [Cypionkella sp.]|nr:hypothetical protein [Cypionkella sp.]
MFEREYRSGQINRFGGNISHYGGICGHGAQRAASQIEINWALSRQRVKDRATRTKGDA